MEVTTIVRMQRYHTDAELVVLFKSTQLLCCSWALLDMAHEFIDVRTRSFGERLIDSRDAFMFDVQIAISERKT